MFAASSAVSLLESVMAPQLCTGIPYRTVSNLWMHRVETRIYGSMVQHSREGMTTVGTMSSDDFGSAVLDLVH